MVGTVIRIRIIKPLNPDGRGGCGIGRIDAQCHRKGAGVEKGFDIGQHRKRNWAARAQQCRSRAEHNGACGGH